VQHLIKFFLPQLIHLQSTFITVELLLLWLQQQFEYVHRFHQLLDFLLLPFQPWLFSQLHL